MKVLMIPQLSAFESEESGIKRVCEAYHKYGPQFGIEYVEDHQPYELTAVHAGITTRFDTSKPLVAHSHGLYWSADYPADAWEWRANAKVIYTARCAVKVTVPSDWVAKSFQRDMHINPTVIHHGIDWQDWRHEYPCGGYVMYNKNRAGVDVCNPTDVTNLARIFPDVKFLTTFAIPSSPENVRVTGVRPNSEMKIMVQAAGVYLSITRETFGIGTLEALASGTPVLGYAEAGNLIMVKHGVNGYLAKPGDMQDLANGLKYCLEHRDILSANAKETVKPFTWEKAVEKVAQVYEDAIRTFQDKRRPHTI